MRVRGVTGTVDLNQLSIAHEKCLVVNVKLCPI